MKEIQDRLARAEFLHHLNFASDEKLADLARSEMPFLIMVSNSYIKLINVLIDIAEENYANEEDITEAAS